MDEFIRDVVLLLPPFEPRDAETVLDWWQDAGRVNGGLAEFLTVQGVFTSNAPRTLEMMAKGYVQFDSAAQLLADGGLRILEERRKAASASKLVEKHTEELTAATTATKSDLHLSTKKILEQQARRHTDSEHSQASTVAHVTQSGANMRKEELLKRLQELTAKGSGIRKVDREAVRAAQASSLATTSPMAAGAGMEEEEAVPKSRLPGIGSYLGKCLLTEQLGQGGAGIVFRALHRTLNISVAVKVLQLSKLRGDRQIYDQLRTEARTLAQLSHPNVIRVLDFEDDPEFPYVVLEYVEGLSVEELIRQSGRVRLDRALQIMMQTADGLAAARRLGIIHRDVKPGNILLTKQGDAKLADLGLAMLVNNPGENGGKPMKQAVAGTAAYMPPEQASGSALVDHRSDIYSLGATFYHALTGQLPFAARSFMDMMMKHAREAPLPPDEIVPELGPEVSRVILTMMAKDPFERYQSYEELIDDLRNVRTGGTTPAVTPVQNAPAPPAGSATPAMEQPGNARASGAQKRSLWNVLFRAPSSGENAS